MYDNIPLEMRLYPQWVAWRYEEVEDSDKPTKVPYCVKTGRLAKTNAPETWCSFDEALQVLKNHNWYNGIGFVLTENDPYAFIDLDDTKGDQIATDRQIKIYNEFCSFAERSPSGKGLHIIIKGEIPSGRKRSFIEIYSQGRFMTMTGDVYRGEQINNYNDLLNALYEQMGEGRNAALFYAGLEKASSTDERILEIAASAANGEKFYDLYHVGNWQKYYPSQSEADFALFDIIAFYSQNGQQTQRIFLNSKLAEREKSRAQYRINYMLNRCFDRMLPPVDIEHLQNKMVEVLAQKEKEEKPTPKAKKVENHSDVYSLPPGLVGDVAKFIYDQAPRPVREIALAGALGFVSGIVGRSYNISGTGLNQYILLLANTGMGKEAIAKGVDKMIAAIVKVVPPANDFVGPGSIASGQAILKYMAKGPTSFVSIVGEVGGLISDIAKPNCPPHLSSLKNFMLDAFNKSGQNNVLRPSIYSDKEKNTVAVYAPAFSMVGETAPEPFYEGLHEGMIANGFLPRFNIIEYHGKRVALNENHMYVQPSFELIEKLATICAHSLMLNGQNKAIDVQLSQDAKKLFDEFNVHCDLNINTSDRETRRHLWNRAHIKALKMAGVIAVGCNPYNPEIDNEVANWAINLVVADVRNMLSRFEAGEIGVDNEETKQLSKVMDCVKDFILHPWGDCVKYAGETFSNLHAAKIIPYTYIHRRLASVAVFRTDRMGATNAIKRALKTLCERGDIQEVGKATLINEYKTNALCYMITNFKII
jgi:hypothetical protein